MCNTTNINTKLSKFKVQTPRNKGGKTQAARSGPETMSRGTAPVQALALQPQPSQSKRMSAVTWRPEREGWSAFLLTLILLLLQDLFLYHSSALGLTTAP